MLVVVLKKKLLHDLQPSMCQRCTLSCTTLSRGEILMCNMQMLLAHAHQIDKTLILLLEQHQLVQDLQHVMPDGTLHAINLLVDNSIVLHSISIESQYIDQCARAGASLGAAL